MLRTFITDPADRSFTKLIAMYDLEMLDVAPTNDTDEIIRTARAAELIVATTPIDGPAEIFREIPRLLALVYGSPDISRIDLRAASRAGVLVTALPEDLTDERERNQFLVDQIRDLVAETMPAGAVNAGMATRLKVLWDRD